MVSHSASDPPKVRGSVFLWRIMEWPDGRDGELEGPDITEEAPEIEGAALGEE